MHQTYVYKLYNNKRKNKYLNDKINLAGSIYNHCIALHKRFYSLYHKSLNKYKLQKHITKLKKTKRFNYWNNISIDVIQQITDRIETSYKLFFNNLKRKRKCSPPSFKKIRKYKSITFKKSGYKFLEDNKIRIMDKIFKIFKSRTMYYNKICTITIKRNNIGEFFIYIVVENDDYQTPLTRSGKSVGMDFGLKTFLTLSNSNKIESPLFFSQNINKIKKLSKKLSKKNKKSNNYKKSLIKLNRLYIDLFNKKKDYFYKLSIKLCQQFDLIAIEDLNISAMKKLWGRKISDLSFSMFVNILNNMSFKYDKLLYKIDRFYPSSKTCNICGNINHNLSLSDRSWTCSNCNNLLDRDNNASINILNKAILDLNSKGIYY